jgi:hypothetical protein
VGVARVPDIPFCKECIPRGFLFFSLLLSAPGWITHILVLEISPYVFWLARTESEHSRGLLPTMVPKS